MEITQFTCMTQYDMVTAHSQHRRRRAMEGPRRTAMPAPMAHRQSPAATRTTCRSPRTFEGAEVTGGEGVTHGAGAEGEDAAATEPKTNLMLDL